MNKLIILAGLILLTAMPIKAFDGERKGFVIDIGIGPGVISVEQEDSEFGGMFDLEFGYAINNQFVVHTIDKTAWYEARWYSGYRSLRLVTVQGISGLGASYFLKPQSPSMFVTGGVGLAYTVGLDKQAASYTGFGFSLGCGYEFARHWKVSANATLGQLKGGGETFNFLTLRVMGSFLIY